MSGPGTQLAAEFADGSLPGGRTPLAHLLHALNQPLTGLQCSLELAVAGPRPAEQYVRTLREGLELTGRMRILVEAIRELTDIQQMEQGEAVVFPIDDLLRQTIDDLLPVAESKGVHLPALIDGALPVRGDRHYMSSLMFRLMESVLTLAQDGTDVRLAANRNADQAVLAISWREARRPEHSPFSRPELGLLVAQAGWKQAGANWTQTRTKNGQTCTIRLPLASPSTQFSHAPSETLK